MAKFDGSITLETKIKLDNVDTQMERLADRIDVVGQKLEKAQKKFADLNKKTTTSEYQESLKQYEKLAKRKGEIENRLNTRRMGSLAKANRTRELEDIISQMSDIEAYQKRMRDSGKAYSRTGTTEEIKEQKNKVRTLFNELNNLNAQLETLASKKDLIYQKEEERAEKERLKEERQIEANYKKANKELALEREREEKELLANELLQKEKEEQQKIVELEKEKKKNIDKTTESYSKTSKKIKSASKMMQMFTNMSRRFLLNMLIFNVVRKAFNSMIQGMKEGIRHYAGYSTQFNKVMSEMLTVTEQLKNAFGSMFAPILTAIVPMVTELANKIIDVTNSVNEFLSAVSGRSTWSRAIKIQKDYSQAVNGTANAMSSLDELTVNGGSDKDFASMFEEVEVSDKVKKNAEAFNEFFDGLRNGFSSVFKEVNEIADKEYTIKVNSDVSEAKRNFTEAFEEIGKATDNITKGFALNEEGSLAWYISELYSNLKEACTNIPILISDVVLAFGKMASWVTGSEAEETKGFWGSLSTIIVSNIKIGIEAINLLLKTFNFLVGALGDIINGDFDTLMDRCLLLVIDAVNGILGALYTLGDMSNTIFDNITNWIIQGFIATIGDALQFVADITSFIPALEDFSRGVREKGYGWSDYAENFKGYKTAKFEQNYIPTEWLEKSISEKESQRNGTGSVDAYLEEINALMESIEESTSKNSSVLSPTNATTTNASYTNDYNRNKEMQLLEEQREWQEQMLGYSKQTAEKETSVNIGDKQILDATIRARETSGSRFVSITKDFVSAF